MRNSLRWLMAAALSLFAMQGYAQHSDITFDVDAGQLVIEAEGHEHGGEEGHGEEEEHHEGGLITQDGKWLFEADFGDFAGGPDSTANPGYATHEEIGVLNPGELIGFEGVGVLQFWDGAAWTTATSATVSIEDAFGALTMFSSAGVVDGSTSWISQADGAGGVHAHVDYNINSEAGVGAYLIEMLLTGYDETGSNEVYAASESYYIAFNRGLGHEEYEAAVDALVGEVPLPGAAIFMLSALSALGLGKSRKRVQR